LATRAQKPALWRVDAVAHKLGAALSPERSYFGLAARVNRHEGPLWLLEPQTYMNLSGKAVAALARFFKITADEILVAHDELDLQPGQMKLKQGGSAAGHNGLKDIQAQLGSADFWRLRLGIGHPGVKAEVENYVLKKPSREHRDSIDECIARSLDSLPLLLARDMTRATMALHTKPKPAAPATAMPVVK